jgi:hypothetical protein
VPQQPSHAPSHVERIEDKVIIQNHAPINWSEKIPGTY